MGIQSRNAHEPVSGIPSGASWARPLTRTSLGGGVEFGTVEGVNAEVHGAEHIRSMALRERQDKDHTLSLASTPSASPPSPRGPAALRPPSAWLSSSPPSRIAAVAAASDEAVALLLLLLLLLLVVVVVEVPRMRSQPLKPTASGTGTLSPLPT